MAVSVIGHLHLASVDTDQPVFRIILVSCRGNGGRVPIRIEPTAQGGWAIVIDKLVALIELLRLGGHSSQCACSRRPIAGRGIRVAQRADCGSGGRRRRLEVWLLGWEKLLSKAR